MASQTRSLYQRCYRLMRLPRAKVTEVNAMYTNHRPIIKAASASHIMEAGEFDGWVNRDRRNQWLSKKLEWMFPDA